MKEKLLITGGAGYLGTRLIDMIDSPKYEITVIDNLSHGHNSLLPFLLSKKIKFIKNDIRDIKSYRKELGKADTVIHLAAIVGYPACSKNPDLAKSVNIKATKDICKNLSKNQRIILASTGSTYGRVQELCTEKTAIAPLTLYGKSKSEAEKYVSDHNNTILRFATVFGASFRMRLDLLINNFVYKALYDKHIIIYQGNAKRTFLHSIDAARSIIMAINNKNFFNNTFNVGCETLNFTKNQIAEKIKKIIPCYIINNEFDQDPDQRDYFVSYEKIKKIGFKPTINLSQGIKELSSILPNLISTNDMFMN